MSARGIQIINYVAANGPRLAYRPQQRKKKIWQELLKNVQVVNIQNYGFDSYVIQLYFYVTD